MRFFNSVYSDTDIQMFKRELRDGPPLNPLGVDTIKGYFLERFIKRQIQHQNIDTGFTKESADRP